MTTHLSAFVSLSASWAMCVTQGVYLAMRLGKFALPFLCTVSLNNGSVSDSRYTGGLMSHIIIVLRRYTWS